MSDADADVENGEGSGEGRLTCWLLDTRSIWPGKKITDSESAQEALSLVSIKEQENITRKYHIADARMSLASALLKRLFIHNTLGIPWKEITFSRKRDPKHGKPCYIAPSSPSTHQVEFNISHQAGLVALVGAKIVGEEGLDVELGVDIVCVNERNDYRVIDEEGFDGWVDMYAEIFSHEELFEMKYTATPFTLPSGETVTAEMLGRQDRVCSRHQTLKVKTEDSMGREEVKTFDSELLIEEKLRRFYTYWCYKEAYIKLDGEALLAKWIPRLEFKNVRAPRPGTPLRCSTHGVWGERISDAEVWFTGGGEKPHGVESVKWGERKRLDDTKLEIQSFGEEFMIGVAAKRKAGKELPSVLTKFVGLNLEGDILNVARGTEY